MSDFLFGIAAGALVSSVVWFVFFMRESGLLVIHARSGKELKLDDGRYYYIIPDAEYIALQGFKQESARRPSRARILQHVEWLESEVRTLGGSVRVIKP